MHTICGQVDCHSNFGSIWLWRYGNTRYYSCVPICHSSSACLHFAGLALQVAAAEVLLFVLCYRCFFMMHVSWWLSLYCLAWISSRSSSIRWQQNLRWRRLRTTTHWCLLLTNVPTSLRSRWLSTNCIASRSPKLTHSSGIHHACCICRSNVKYVDVIIVKFIIC